MSAFFSRAQLDQRTDQTQPIHTLYEEDWDEPGAYCPWCLKIGKQYDVPYPEVVLKYHGRTVEELPGDSIFVIFSNQAVELGHTIADSVRQLLDLNKLKAAIRKDEK